MSTRARHALSIAALLAIWATMLVCGRNQLDRNLYEALYVGGHPTLVFVAWVFTMLGEHIVLIGAGFAGAILLWITGRARMGVVLFVVMLLGRALDELQKVLIARPRPELEPHLVVVKTLSFPSGHALNSIVFYLTLALAFAGRTRWRWAAVSGAILLSLLIGTSRVMLGVHWPSDVIAGWAFGLLWVLLTFARAEQLYRTEPVKRVEEP